MPHGAVVFEEFVLKTPHWSPKVEELGAEDQDDEYAPVVVQLDQTQL